MTSARIKNYQRVRVRHRRIRRGHPSARPALEPRRQFVGKQLIVNCFIIPLLVLSVWKWYEHQLNLNSAADAQTYRASAGIRNHFEAALHTMACVRTLEQLRAEQPSLDGMKAELRMVHERISGLKAQCLQYERMEWIPGGPTNFITSAWKDANNEIGVKLIKLYSTFQHISRNETQARLAVVQTCLKVFARLDNANIALRDMSGHLLVKYGGIYTQAAAVPLAAIADDGVRASLEEVVEHLKELPGLFLLLENDKDLLEDAALTLGLGIEDFPDEDTISALSPQDQEIIRPLRANMLTSFERVAMYLTLNRQHVKQFQILAIKELNSAITLSEEVARQENHERIPYLQLFQSTQRELLNLVKRIDNLRYKYDKHKLPKIIQFYVPAI